MDASREYLDAAAVERALYEAGRTSMAQHVPGCWPAGFRSGMPQPQVDPEDLQYAEAEYTVPQPMARDVSEMDRAELWISLLRNGTPAELLVVRLVRERMRVSPRTDKPVLSWRRLGEKFGISHVWAKTLWLRAMDTLVPIANRPDVCNRTFARIKYGAQRATPVQARALPLALQPRPLPAVCAATARRIAQAAPTPAPATVEATPAKVLETV